MEFSFEMNNNMKINTSQKSGMNFEIRNLPQKEYIEIERKFLIIEMKKYLGEVFSERKISAGAFSCTNETVVFIDCTMIATGNGLLTVAIKVNGIQQDLQPKINQNGYETLHFTLPVRISGGKSNVEILADGVSEIENIQAFVYGQEITAETLDRVENGDYIYTINDGLTTIISYNSANPCPAIPDDLGGGKTAVISYGAFTKTTIKNCYIPDGVVEIK